MNNDHETWASEEAWGPDGHPSDVVLTALADGQSDLVAESVVAHVGSCERCTARLGEAALASLDVGTWLSQLPMVVGQPIDAAAQNACAVQQSAWPPARGLPRLALVVALALASVGAVPTVVDVGGSIEELPARVVRGAPVLLRALGSLVTSLFEQAASAAPVVWCAAVGLLLVLGLMIARLGPERPTAQEDA